ncbi:unnamed protein product [Trifolium pratense]|uniref:Uncharacterized protein n=1 Tax=Trifolium pratense TaxID=57577 RepID=A0ACB0JMI9_TRIPR|nr:unnamed protein product [Trifolium pratense]
MESENTRERERERERERDWQRRELLEVVLRPEMAVAEISHRVNSLSSVKLTNLPSLAYQISSDSELQCVM